MNCELQSKKIKPDAKSCNWCKYFSDDFECTLPCDKAGYLTHRQITKLYRENEFRYCKSYKYSKKNFNGWKKEREINLKKYLVHGGK